MTSLVLPSGEQIELTLGDQTAVVVTVSGGVRHYSVAGRNVLDGYDETAVCDGARGQLLVPWANRVKDGRWSRDGVDHQLAITEPEQHTAIHGLSRWSNWTLLSRSESSARLGVRIAPQPGWDWPLDVEAHHQLTGDGLSVTTSITNRGSSVAPVSAGAHPYLAPGTALIDDATLRLPAATRLTTGAQQIPTGTEPVEGTAFDFREPKLLGDFEIDFAFTDLIRDDDGRARVTLTAPDGSWNALWVDEAFAWLEVFTGDALPNAARRRQGLGVEPMSAPPNALVSGEGLHLLEPGQTWTGQWGVESSVVGSARG